MKLLLCEDVERLGYLGDIVDVKPGYARNYLLPCGLAMVPTEGNMKSLAEEKAKRAKERQVVRERLEKAITAVEGAEVVLSAKANEQGHLYGSVSEKEIGDNLRAQGFEVKDSMVQVPEHIKETGEYEVSVCGAEDIKATVKVVVVAESAGAEDTTEQDPETKSETADGSESAE